MSWKIWVFCGMLNPLGQPIAPSGSSSGFCPYPASYQTLEMLRWRDEADCKDHKPNDPGWPNENVHFLCMLSADVKARGTQ
jgi:hypothetical protein